MKDYLEKRPWEVIEKSFHGSYNKITESIFSLGNGYMGHRGNFEERFSGCSMKGSYLAGIYYPDKTRVGWWKNGYPEYFAKVLNSIYWIGFEIEIDDNILDLNEVEFLEFERKLDMRTAVLSKEIVFKTKDGFTFKIASERFCSVDTKEIGAQKYKISSIDFSGSIKISPYLDFNVYNEDSNYDEKFWVREGENDRNFLSVSARTKKTNFVVEAQMFSKVTSESRFAHEKVISSGFVSDVYRFNIDSGESIELEKLVSIQSSFNHPKEKLYDIAKDVLSKAKSNSYDKLKQAHISVWDSKWNQSDVIIEGDVSAQQGIRFNIFQLHQTYTGEDERLNIGPKGFTGEKYGGSTYWDTEAYCFPFYLSTSSTKVPKNLLIYRYKHLQKAIENAEKLGFKNGAALYPMVTMNGEECHNEWEITFEEIHRNGAIAYAIYDYINYTGSKTHMVDYGLEVLIAISRFWAQRVNFSQSKKQYVILGVTGPNEYENNVSNNWYTNYIAKWCLNYTIASVELVQKKHKKEYEKLINKINFDDVSEINNWQEITNNMYLPYDNEHKVFLQQDGFLDKDLIPSSSIPESEVPIHQNWSWDRILRSCFIKQADVLQGLYFFEHHFDKETIERNFKFYEPMTVHESSLSSCVHSILANRINAADKAYEMYLRTARLDLEDYNNDTEDGLHITSMAGSWMAIVKGYGGMKVDSGVLHFEPKIPKQWKSYSFLMRFRSRILKIVVNSDLIKVRNIFGEDLEIKINNQFMSLPSQDTITVPIKELQKA